MKKAVAVLVVILVAAVFVYAVGSCPFMKEKGGKIRYFLAGIKLPGCISGITQGVELKRGELYSKDGMWHTPYEVVRGDATIMKGEVVSGKVVAPYLAGIKGGDIIIRYRGADLSPAKPEKEPKK